MSDLLELPNLGPVVCEQLARAGIRTADELRRRGSLEAALALVDHGVDVCTSKLSALEGAVRGIRWHRIPAEDRRELWRRFEGARSRRTD